MPDSASSAPKRVIPKPNADVAARLEALMADVPAYRRSMFGTVAWFLDANAQMFAGVWGDEVYVRVGAEEASRLIDAGEAAPFGAMPTRAREYVLVPASTMGDAELRRWVEDAARVTGVLAAAKPRRAKQRSAS